MKGETKDASFGSFMVDGGKGVCSELEKTTSPEERMGRVNDKNAVEDALKEN